MTSRLEIKAASRVALKRGTDHTKQSHPRNIELRVIVADLRV